MGKIGNAPSDLSDTEEKSPRPTNDVHLGRDHCDNKCATPDPPVGNLVDSTVAGNFGVKEVLPEIRISPNTSAIKSAFGITSPVFVMCKQLEALPGNEQVSIVSSISADNLMDFLKLFRRCTSIWHWPTRKNSTRLRRLEAYQLLYLKVKYFDKNATFADVRGLVRRLKDIYAEHIGDVATNDCNGIDGDGNMKSSSAAEGNCEEVVVRDVEDADAATNPTDDVEIVPNGERLNDGQIEDETEKNKIRDEHEKYKAIAAEVGILVKAANQGVPEAQLFDCSFCKVRCGSSNTLWRHMVKCHSIGINVMNKPELLHRTGLKGPIKQYKTFSSQIQGSSAVHSTFLDASRFRPHEEENSIYEPASKRRRLSFGRNATYEQRTSKPTGNRVSIPSNATYQRNINKMNAFSMGGVQRATKVKPCPFLTEYKDDFLLAFITLYEKNKCLWNQNDRSYRSQSTKSHAYHRLIQFYRTTNNALLVGLPEIKQLIRRLRGVYKSFGQTSKFAYRQHIWQQLAFIETGFPLTKQHDSVKDGVQTDGQDDTMDKKSSESDSSDDDDSDSDSSDDDDSDSDPSEDDDSDSDSSKDDASENNTTENDDEDLNSPQ